MKEEVIGSRRLLVYELSQEETLDSVLLGMMEHNAIQGLLAVTFLQKDEQQILKYDCSGMTALADFLEQVQDGIWLVSFFTELAGILFEAEEYMIPESSFLFGLDTVFITPKGNAGLVCLPLEEGQEETFRQFCSRVLKTSSAAKSLGQGLLAQLHAYLSSETFSIQEFLRLLDQIELQSAISMTKTVPKQRGPVVLGKKDRVGKKQPAMGKAKGYLYRKSSDEKIGIDKEEFQIGKGSGPNDYRVRGNSFVSRRHAKITRQGETFYITDLHATNYTYVGGKRLESGQSAALDDQTVIRLANEEFIFLIEE